MSALRLMIIDPHPSLLKGLVRFLSLWDSLEVVGSASRTDDALALVGELRPDVVVVDPTLLGTEIIDRVRALVPDACVVALCLHDAETDREDALAAGADAFVPKYFVIERLVETIRRTCGVPCGAGGAPHKGGS